MSLPSALNAYISAMLAPFGTTMLELVILASFAQFALMFFRKTAYQKLGQKLGQKWEQTSLQPSLALCNATLLMIAFIALIYGFATSNFGLELVVLHSHTQKPMLYKITATWGNHEGSMLLWCLILSLYSAYMSLRLREFRPVALAIMGLMQILFVGYLRIFSNPFAEMISAVTEGQGFNPLLQDFGLAIHPPILYAGYVGFAASFALAIAILLHKNSDTQAKTIQAKPVNFGNILHPYIMFPWAMLTAGIAMGSWWAYRELGWGGWWFWDPVENVALLPWLCATALFHANLILRKTGNMPRYVLLLAITCFALSVIGTFLVRSGLLNSVHSFASDPTRGVAICAIMMVITTLGIGAYLRGAGRFAPAKPCKLFSKETLILANNLLLLLTTAMIFLATFYPFIIEAISDKRITIGAEYFSQIFAALMLPMIAGCALSNYLAWSDANDLQNINYDGEITHNKTKHSNITKRKKQLFITLIESTIITSIACYFLGNLSLGNLSIMLVLGVFCGIWLMLATLKTTIARAYNRTINIRQIPMLLGHLGLGLFVLSVTLFGAYHQSAEFVMQKNDVRTAFGDYQVSLNNVEFGEGENYVWQQGDVRILHDNHELQLTPEERYYAVEEQFTTEAAIKHFATYDLYVTMRRINDNVSVNGDSNGNRNNNDAKNATNTELPQQKYMIYIYFNPAMIFLWLSVAMMVIAGVIASYNVRNKPCNPKNYNPKTRNSKTYMQIEK